MTASAKRAALQREACCNREGFLHEHTPHLHESGKSAKLPFAVRCTKVFYAGPSVNTLLLLDACFPRFALVV
jgi:hypothetical protein